MATTSEFKTLLKQYKLTHQKAATLLHVTAARVSQWIYTKKIPEWALQFLKRKLESFVTFPEFIHPTAQLKQIRERQGLTYKQISDIIGVPTKRILQWNYHQNVPPWAIESLMLGLLLDKAVITTLQQVHFDYVVKQKRQNNHHSY